MLPIAAVLQPSVADKSKVFCYAGSEVIVMTFEEKLKQLRMREKYSQEQLAELMHVSRQAVTKWENGGGMPDVSNLLAIADLFDVTLDSLLRDEEELETTDEGLCWNISLACAGIGLVLGIILREFVQTNRIVGLCVFGGGFIGWAVFYIILQVRRTKRRENKRGKL